MIEILDDRKQQIYEKGKKGGELACERASLAGSVSQRACVFCGSRVVLYPIADAVHLVHGPVGCAAYTWDIRGSLSSGPELHRLSFSTDLQEREVIFGGEKKLYAALTELITAYHPNAAFVYATCIIGLIGDDVQAVCNKVQAEQGIPVIPVHSEGFRGTKKDGYKAACEAIYRLIGTDDETAVSPYSINILGDFNLAGETWVIKEYYRQMGIDVVSCITGDGRVAEIGRSHRAALNVVQCSGSMTYLAKMLEESHAIPYRRVSYFGIEDTAEALYSVARHFEDDEMLERTVDLVRREVNRIYPEVAKYRRSLEGRKAAIYVGGSFKAFSLVKALRHLGIQSVVVGSQTGNAEDYEYLKEICDEGTIIVDDTNPLELSRFITEKGVDLLIGGVKERPIAYKMGVAFCDHNHERKTALAGFEGMLNFCKEVHGSIMSPVWEFSPAWRNRMSMRAGRGAAAASAAQERWDMRQAKQLAHTEREGNSEHFVSTRNACKLCSPLGASIAFRGIENCIPLIHGSQGCSTYIRRYVISHFKEPIDIASSNFSEESAIFGGGDNLKKALDNITRQYEPEVVGIATTCLSETIGDDVGLYLDQYRKSKNSKIRMPAIIHASTPSYRGTHMEGYHEAIRATVEALAEGGACDGSVNLIPGFLSSADLRHLKEIMSDFGTDFTMFPDYSETLDGESWADYQRLSSGGTSIASIKRMGKASATIQLGRSLKGLKSAARHLEEKFGVSAMTCGLPIGIRENDAFFETLGTMAGMETPEKYLKERYRLVDAYIDGHKYVFGKRAVLYGEADLVTSMATFLDEIGITPVLCATGAATGTLEQTIKATIRHNADEVRVVEETDFATMLEACETLKPDIVIGSSKGYFLSKRLGVPLVRVGFPIHDRVGGQRILHVGYRGTQQLFDTIANALIEHWQETGSVGYSYM